MSPQEKEIRTNLALAYRIFSKLGMDDLTYTHLSARVPGEDAFFIYPFGLLFSEVTASSLLKVTFDGIVLEGEEEQYNKTGFIIHGAIYKARKDLNAIFHLHTTAGVAVSAMEEGLLPISQFSFHFYNRHSYHNYDSLALDHNRHGNRLVDDLGKHKVMFLRNHGTLCAGSTLQEAFFYSYYLEQACKTQIAACSSGQKLIMPSAETCEQAAEDMRNFEPSLGNRDWNALKRIIDKEDNSYMDINYSTVEREKNVA
jgi:ribulose-5-phosphate 4-epimerase/fuculose-1-phosphate aldolase